MYAETGHDLVEDQDRAMRIAELAQPLQKTGLGCDQVHVTGDRLDDDAGNFIRLVVECRLDLIEIVVRQHQCLAGNRCRHAGRRWLTESKRARACLNQHAVAVAVVAAFEFDDFGTTGVATRQPQRGHGRLGARAH